MVTSLTRRDRSLLGGLHPAPRTAPQALDPAPPFLLLQARFARGSGGGRGAPGLAGREGVRDQILKPLERRFLVPGLAPVALARHPEGAALADPRSQGVPDSRALLGRDRGAQVDVPARFHLRLQLVHVLSAGSAG